MLLIQFQHEHQVTRINVNDNQHSVIRPRSHYETISKQFCLIQRELSKFCHQCNDTSATDLLRTILNLCIAAKLQNCRCTAFQPYVCSSTNKTALKMSIIVSAIDPPAILQKLTLPLGFIISEQTQHLCLNSFSVILIWPTTTFTSTGIAQLTSMMTTSLVLYSAVNICRREALFL